MSCEFGFYAAHEQYDPESLLNYAVSAEKNGFDNVWSSDHFHPWTHTGAHSGFAWVWLSAVAERTKKVSIGSVTAPLLRYHPAIIAQVFATLNFMYPNRIFLCLATGESMNESPLGLRWPSYKERLERLEESIKIIKSLWSENFVDFEGKYYRLRKANLYTKPKTKIPIYVAASGPTTAYVAGKYADGLLTSARIFEEKFKNEILPAFERGAKSVDRESNKLKRIVHVIISYDEYFDRAVESCKFWNATMVPGIFNAEIYDPREIERLAQTIKREETVKRRFIATSEEGIIRKIEQYLKMGINEVEFLSTSLDQNKFIELFGKRIIPYFKKHKM